MFAVRRLSSSASKRLTEAVGAVQIAAGAGIDHAHLFSTDRANMRLLQEFGEALAAGQLLLVERPGRAELGEGGQFAVLANSPLIGPEACFIALIWARSPPATPRCRRSPPGGCLVEQVGLQEIWPSVIEITLSGYRPKRRCLGLDQGQGGQRTEPLSSFNLAARSKRRECR